MGQMNPKTMESQKTSLGYMDRNALGEYGPNGTGLDGVPDWVPGGVPSSALSNWAEETFPVTPQCSDSFGQLPISGNGVSTEIGECKE